MESLEKNEKNDSDLRLKELNTVRDDQLIDRKRSLNSKVDFIGRIPLPSIVEISESGTCNRKCAFCPRSAPHFQDKKEFISPELVGEIASQLGALDYKGLVLFSGFVEPLLDVRLKDHIATIRNAAVQCRIEIVTNGDPITVVNLNDLHEAGLNTLLVSCYDGEHQIKEIGETVLKSKMPTENVVYRRRWLGADENFGISLSNRGGMMKTAEYAISDLAEPWKNSCFYPANTFFMDYNGDVLICAHDWGKKAVVGNLNNQNFLEIWTGATMSKFRRRLIRGSREFSPCNVCNVEGTRMGIEHANAWTASDAEAQP